VVTHEMQSAFRIANHVVMLHEGKAVAAGSPEEIRSSADPVVRQFIEGKADGPIPLRMARTDYAKAILEEE
jgi:phospholipid/cholesterol/gamma-HCH transport system ATP-binding protein